MNPEQEEIFPVFRVPKPGLHRNVPPCHRGVSTRSVSRFITRFVTG